MLINKKKYYIIILLIFISISVFKIIEVNNKKMKLIQKKQLEEQSVKLEEQKRAKEVEEYNKLSQEEKNKIEHEKRIKALTNEINYRIKTIDSNYLDDDNYTISYDEKSANIVINFSTFKGRFPDVRFKHCVAIVQDIYINTKDFLQSKKINNIIFNQIKDEKIHYTYTFNVEKMRINNFDKVKSSTIHFIDSMDDIDKLFEG